MLRGCSHCAISGRPKPSSAPKYPLSPIIPVHPRNSPVSPIIPVHPQKQGGGALKKLSATSDQRSGNKKKADPVLHSIPGDFNRLGNSAPSCRLSAVNCELAFRTSHSRTMGNCCPTGRARSNMYHYITYRCRRADNFASCKHHRNSPKRSLRFHACYRLSTVDCGLLFSPKSNYSRTYESPSRKSNHSRTYENRGEGVGYLNGNVPKICRRADNSTVARRRANPRTGVAERDWPLRGNPRARNQSKDWPLHWKGGGPPQKAGPYTNCRLSAVNFAPRETELLRV